MNRLTALLLAGLIALAGCGETPIRKTNCWNSMSLLPNGNCEFHHVPTR
ncbi:hypothetical protein PY32053_04676 (plasmid) [Paracoccus yeei]|jgi:hypothetical protein|uniref:Lipoprotein n=1 Tax=Paracoccus yeei TaxID=147645 RepID=A0A386UU18_9RHOB|nr:hypothetical protein [Paracoccus yeei]AYF04167.1 hypothetical protein PY32053_04676 [Paracoccus yeei]